MLFAKGQLGKALSNLSHHRPSALRQGGPRAAVLSYDTLDVTRTPCSGPSESTFLRTRLSRWPFLSFGISSSNMDMNGKWNNDAIGNRFWHIDVGIMGENDNSLRQWKRNIGWSVKAQDILETRHVRPSSHALWPAQHLQSLPQLLTLHKLTCMVWNCKFHWNLPGVACCTACSYLHVVSYTFY